MQQYNEKLQYPLDQAFGKGTKVGMLYGISQVLLQFTFGILFYVATLIMRDYPQTTRLNMIYAIMGIVWSGWYAGNTFYFFPDALAGKKAAQSIFKLLDEEDQDQLQVKSGSKRIESPFIGSIQFKKVYFQYNPNDDYVLKGIDLMIEEGQKIAFVGPSGCGKSTIFQILQRFYDYQGDIMLNGIQLRNYDIHHIRSCLVGVSQDPSLFAGTIGYNINYNSKARQ